MGEKWLDAYARWPAVNQLLFSCVFVLAAMVLLFLAGLFVLHALRYLAVSLRGWPKQEGDGKHDEDVAAVRALLEGFQKTRREASRPREPVDEEAADVLRYDFDLIPFPLPNHRQGRPVDYKELQRLQAEEQAALQEELASMGDKDSGEKDGPDGAA